MQLSSITPDATALKALSHPVRLRILGLLRSDGPATATTLAARLGMNSGATSYHLRQLAQHGFVVDDAERGNGRDRWWKAAHQSTRTNPPAAPEEREAHDAFAQAVAVVHTEMLQRAVEERPLVPAAWQGASTLSDWSVRLTPARAQALLEALVAVVEDVEEEPGEDGAADYTVVLHAFPRPGRIATEGPAEAAAEGPAEEER
ncbi:ArsR/SmtB family transcription factor [Nocardioides pacificus]